MLTFTVYIPGARFKRKYRPLASVTAPVVAPPTIVVTLAPGITSPEPRSFTTPAILPLAASACEVHIPSTAQTIRVKIHFCKTRITPPSLTSKSLDELFVENNLSFAISIYFRVISISNPGKWLFWSWEYEQKILSDSPSVVNSLFFYASNTICNSAMRIKTPLCA